MLELVAVVLRLNVAVVPPNPVVPLVFVALVTAVPVVLVAVDTLLLSNPPVVALPVVADDVVATVPCDVLVTVALLSKS